MKRILIGVLVCFFTQSGLFAGISDVEVILSSRVDLQQVPLNRHLTLTIEIAWEGDVDLISVSAVEEPVLTNFEVVGTASSNRMSESESGRRAVRTIRYTLRPTTLGMAYIEATGLIYVDQSTGKSHTLKSQRLGVKVVDPLPEAEKSRFSWFPILLLFAAVAGFAILLKRKKPKEKIEPPRLIEEIFLHELKGVDLKNMDRRQEFSKITKIFRVYLSKKYRFSTLDATTEELISMMRDQDLDESLIRKSETLLARADLVKFSGQDATQAELADAYTTVETLLQSPLAQSRNNSEGKGIPGKKRLRSLTSRRRKKNVSG